MYLCRFPGQQGQGQSRIRSFSELPLVLAVLRIKELTQLQLSLGETSEDCPVYPPSQQGQLEQVAQYHV